MLTDLVITNFAIIERLQLSLGPGLTVLTGETGAGKSIILDAVGLLLGDRARPELIRTGAEEATVEALFAPGEGSELEQSLAAAGLPAGEELLVRRCVCRSGPNRAWINGSLVTLAQLRALVEPLVAIYGQHEHQTLQRGEAQRALLDRFGGLGENLSAYRDAFRETEELRRRLAELEQAVRDREAQRDLLRFQLQEIEAVAPREGEDDELAAERLRLLHGERLASASEGGYDTLYGADGALCERLDGVAAELEGLVEVAPELGRTAEVLRSCQYTLEDLALQLRDYRAAIIFDAERQQEVEERLARLTGLKRKYAPSLEAVLGHLEGLRERLAALEGAAASREELENRLDRQRRELQNAGERLGRERADAARRLEEAVEAHLGDLQMGGTRFEVRLHPLEEPGPHGLERVELFLAANPGEEPRPLARIASGGELSRIMLALKCASPEGDAVATQVYDEIDAGVGGRAATAVGEKLLRVARDRQVLCVTHLPQVAAFADHHLRVEKQVAAGRTLTAVTPQDGSGRVEEIARMLAGTRITDQSLAHARELVRASRGS